MTKLCPLCGHQTLQTRQGDYHFDPPANVPGGVIILSEATWFECTNCGEEILPNELTLAIEAEQRHRLAEPVAVNP